MMNIVLIGMPGSGKSTLGKHVAKELNMEFLDTDVLIERQEKRPISEIFKTEGEPYFRRLETAVIDVIANIAQGTADEDRQNNGLVLSVGGGAAENPANVERMRDTGMIVYIERPLETLERDISYNGNRPLLSDREKLVELYERRAPRYSAVADKVIANSGGFDAAAEKLIRLLKLTGVKSDYLVIGDPIGHTLSPALHRAVYQALASNGNLITGALPDALSDAQAEGLITGSLPGAPSDAQAEGLITGALPDALSDAQAEGLITSALPGAPSDAQTKELITGALPDTSARDLREVFAAASYGFAKVPPEALEESMRDMRAGSVRGINVTIPHKKAIIPFLDEVVGDAATAGAVNTVVHRDGKLTGYNTDMEGLRFALESRGIQYKGAVIAVCGTGGAASGVVCKAASCGASEIFLIGRNEEKASAILEAAERLAASPVHMAFIRHDFERDGISDEFAGALARTGLFINATPLGMSSAGRDFLSFSFLDILPAGAFLFDIVYDPLETALLRAARDRGLGAEGGLSMLLYQGILSDERFFGVAFDRKALYEMIRGNVVL